MEALRTKAKSAFAATQQFNETHHTVSRLQLTRSDGGEVKLDATDLVCPATAHYHPANLRLGIHSDTFSRMIQEFHIEPHVLYLIAHNIDGFFSFSDKNGTPSQCDDSCISYFLHVRDRYMLTWSYSPQSAKTCAILIARPRSPGSSKTTAFAEQIRKEIITYTKLLGHPLALAVICCSWIMDEISLEITPELAAIADTESKTGFNPFEGGSVASSKFFGDKRRESDDLGVLSGLMSSTSVVLALHKKNCDFSWDLLQRMQRDELLSPGWRALILEGGWDEYERLSHAVSEVSSVLLAQCDAAAPYIALLRERANVQHSVISNLIAKQEYLATIELAKESRSIALATKNDSSSMKAIAFATLTFLPATFFAAVFALPLLDWDGEGGGPVIRDKFWVYLAFSIPCTLGVMGAWLGFARYQAGKQRAVERRERRRVATNLSGSGGGGGSGGVGGGDGEKMEREPTTQSGGKWNSVSRWLAGEEEDDASRSESGTSMSSVIVAPNVRRRRLARAIGIQAFLARRGSDTGSLPTVSSTRFRSHSDGSDPPEAVGLWSRLMERLRGVLVGEELSESESESSSGSDLA
ncbi:predicted protein [Chaetomium globosum CBS 148.51]|uniref:Uncharacterized protein n=1 Tax=Chaetomium globosum (strain ATCC 6205 / CBS 148.51 / DSM 1962 / NBRC 6347 / NRRL 1970) TaxID=306901 RepID=Q2H277_CHAGB|nr:uncharacterized protein CHGG_04119 [Chaetomium globosum CBS 148.51]EAQ87500.1 predicted protein [Chaetomium globosum CBS 148.51]